MRVCSAIPVSVWTTCYTTCELYSRRPNGGCRRFSEGMVRIDFPESLNGYLLKIRFKRWGKLWSVGNTRLYSLSTADRVEKRDLRIARCINNVPINALKVKIGQKRASWKSRWAERPARNREVPNCMLLECYNPNEGNVSMTLTIRSKSSPISSQALIPMQPGFNRHRIGMTDIARSIDASAKFGVELAPNEIADGCTLFFGAMDFVVDAAYVPMEKGVPADSPSNQTASTRFCKCVVWDMDNTLWDGILVEDGSEGIRLKSGIVEILKTLDERGILISAVSKNNQEDAMAALRRFDIVDYFLFRKYPGIPRAMPFSKLRATSILGLIPCCLSMTPPLSVRRSRLSVPMSWC